MCFSLPHLVDYGITPSLRANLVRLSVLKVQLHMVEGTYEVSPIVAAHVRDPITLKDIHMESKTLNKGNMVDNK